MFFLSQLELEKVKKRRLEREREREQRDQEQEALQRDKEIEYFREWEKQEDSVSVFALSIIFSDKQILKVSVHLQKKSKMDIT